jgi:hypothetical protein
LTALGEERERRERGEREREKEHVAAWTAFSRVCKEFILGEGSNNNPQDNPLKIDPPLEPRIAAA